jgi:hypothetical protein
MMNDECFEKFEIRISKSETMSKPKIQMLKTALAFPPLPTLLANGFELCALVI